MNIRLASGSDSEALRNIYGQYIDTPITFECSLPTKQEFANRVEEISLQYPYLVCEENGRIAGYAYAHRHKQREAYQWNAELSVYLNRDDTSRGVGTQLYHVLIEILKLQQIRNVYAAVTVPNSKSEGLHETMGFRRLGTFRKTGYKCGKWLDVAWFEKEILSRSQCPQPFLSIQALSSEKLEKIIKTF